MLGTVISFCSILQALGEGIHRLHYLLPLGLVQYRAEYLVNLTTISQPMRFCSSVARERQAGLEVGVHKGYLCRHRRPWYSQENRPPAPFLCTYMNRRGAGSKKLFRFILNHSRATATNVYLMLYPKPDLEEELKGRPNLRRAVWLALSRIAPEALAGEGRVYGGGLHKLEPKELGKAPANNIIEVLPDYSNKTLF